MGGKEKLSDYAYKTLKQMILSNAFKPGEHLEEINLCEKLNISRTPLREAINRLIYENLLISVAQKGIFVPELSLQATAELFRARKLVEPMVILLSAKRLNKDIIMSFREKTTALLDYNGLQGANAAELHLLDYEFHNYINSNCGNQYILRNVIYISDQFQRVRTQDFFPVERAVNGAFEHLKIIDAIMNGDHDVLPSLILDHIISTENYYYKNMLDDDVPKQNIDFLKQNMDSITQR